MPLYNDAHPTDGIRASGSQHLVQHRDADGYLGLLSLETACSQPGSDQRLVAANRRFDRRALAIICCLLPSQSSLFRDHLEMPVTLCERTWFTTEHGRRAWRNHDLNIIAVCCDHAVGGSAVIRAVSRYPGDRDIDLIQQWRNLRLIVIVLIRQCLSDYHAIFGIDRQMKLAPCPARLRAVFGLQPLAGPVNLQARAIDQ